LSYVTQNYYRPNTNLRLTYRRYYSWLFSNAAAILTLVLQLSQKNKGVWLNLTFIKNPTQFINTFFSKGLTRLFTKAALSWRPLVESQFVKGLEYWAYTSNITLLSKTVVKLAPKASYSSTYFFNQVWVEKSYTSITLYNKYYRTVLINFLFLLIRGWQAWQPYFTFTSGLIFVSKDLHLLKFFNTRLFKILSV
jgi:hypothetical protein